MNDRILVLLSSYNGAEYIEQQLDSILNQTLTNIDILVRDDGSVDNTLKILRKYQKNYNNIKLIIGQNRGVVKSFFELIRNAELTYDYYVFSDQDDFWKPNKIEKMIDSMKKYNINEKLGYCSNLILVDKDLNFLKLEYKNELHPSLKNSFVENIVTGCTYGANKNMFKKIKENIEIIGEEVDDIPMHDHYFYFLTCLHGKLIYDPNSYIFYRQHDNNVIGMDNNLLKKLLKRGINVLKRSSNDKRIRYLKFLINKFENILPKNEKKYLYEILNSYPSLILRVSNINKISFERQNLYEAKLLKLLYILKKF